MVIRDSQAAAFSSTASEKYEERVLLHLRRCFPNQSQAMGESAVRSLIRHGISRAAEYHITAERDVCKFSDLMMAFGRDFDREQWASSILHDRDLRDPTLRLETLYEAGKQKQPRTEA